ncbi:hypothetical protein KTD19_12520 [Burkholderia multivorans]|uniref:hypothetical protein n=1 Tax=Burkholderia multivorans TaxID=87883 RepID=UPI0012DC9BAE|nr:hypothetical protein [Burkholderia multivorans]MBU9233217.1 hypothetical protein [Burkholderia multivorans]QGR95071.1 hypothetical protein FOC30_30105 [Burkholderia multivorans]HEF4739708.1 hypothetical protein [Burkholderia multivorans]
MNDSYLGHRYRLTDHCCRVCFARVLTRSGADGADVYRCSNCGFERAGVDASTICACGLRLADGRDARVRCLRNESPSPLEPSEIVAAALTSSDAYA